MKKLFLVLMVSLICSSAWADEIEVPLFEDETPNLGNNSKPKDYIVLTPSELPEVRVQLTEDEAKSAKPVPRPQAVSQQQEAPVTPRRPISLSGGQLSQQRSDEMNKRLEAEIQQYQEEKTKAELEKAAQEAQKAREQAVAAPKPDPAKEVAQMPDSLNALFGKMHDVRTFDVSGFELGMRPDEVLEVAQERGYHVVRVEHGIPLHRTSFYEANCRRAQVRRVEALQSCIIEQAQNDEVYYISSMTLDKPDTAEKMQLLFSSMATDNGVYKIYYENEGDNSLNFTRKNLAKKIRRRDAFWKLIYDTYGAPDDRENMVWGDTQSAYMKVAMQGSNYNAYIILEDREPTDNDYIDANEQAADLHYRHPFTFAAIPDEDEE